MGRKQKTVRDRDLDYRDLVEDLNDIIYILDNRGKFEYLSSATEFYGFRPEELIGRLCTDIVIEEDVPKVLEEYKRVRDTGKSDQFEFRIKTRTGETVSLLTRTKGIYEGSRFKKMRGVLTDITDIKNIEAALQESEERYRTIFHHSPDAIMILENNRFVDGNETTLKIFGIDRREEFIGRHPADISPASQPDGRGSREKADEMIAEAFEKGSNRFEWVHRRTNGEDFFAIVILVAFRFRHRKLIQAVVRDITSRKIAEEQLQASLREKEVLIREIHHRVKNNMQIVSSLTNLHARQISDKESLGIFQNLDRRIRAMALVHEMLYKSEDFTQVDCDLYLKKISSILIESLGLERGKIRIVHTISDMHLSIDRAIPSALIITELITNACKHAFAGSERGEIHILFEKKDDTNFLIVSDNGKGIPEGIEFGETGSFGFSIIHSLVKQLHGTIEIDRTEGTIITITFPDE